MIITRKTGAALLLFIPLLVWVPQAVAWKGHHRFHRTYHYNKHGPGPAKKHISKRHHSRGLPGRHLKSRYSGKRHHPKKLHRSHHSNIKYKQKTTSQIRHRKKPLHRRKHRYSYYGYRPYRTRHFRGYYSRYPIHSGSSYHYRKSADPNEGISDTDTYSNQAAPSKGVQPKGQWEVTYEWVPPKTERVLVPGRWTNGIKKTWTGTHWKFETDTENRIWIEEYYKSVETEPGYYKERITKVE